MNFLFDPGDRELQKLLKKYSNSSKKADFFADDSHLHPHGIKEAVSHREVRVATLLIRLLNSLESEKYEERLKALHALRDEVFFSAESSMSKNTARVLLEIMKELIRVKDDDVRQLELAHEFRSVMSGKPAVIRRFLKKYHLLEMPEEWNQIAFDHHVHDAHTKGRKTPSHLIMDAWIKGIRNLTVIYYEYIPVEAAKELLIAAKYMQIKVRIGVEYITNFHKRPIQLIWIPRGFADINDFIRFLETEGMKQFTEKGKEAAKFAADNVLDVLENFNHKERLELNKEYGIELKPLDKDDFKTFVKEGLLSMLHLSEYIHHQILPLFEERIKTLKAQTDLNQQEIDSEIKKMDELDSEAVFSKYLKGKICLHKIYSDDCEQKRKLPELMTYTPTLLLDKLEDLRSGYRITLNLTDLTPEDVMELVYVCKGRITNLEIYNHKDYISKRTGDIETIRKFQHALNEGNTINLKRTLRNIIEKLENSESPEDKQRAEIFHEILINMKEMMILYKARPLKDTWGSDSTGKSSGMFGMGFAIKETLPSKAIKYLKKSKTLETRTVPVHIDTKLEVKYDYNEPRTILGELLPKRFSLKKTGTFWTPAAYSRNAGKYNNVISLGAGRRQRGNGFMSQEIPAGKNGLVYNWTYMNSGLKNLIKIIIGFVPAFFTFFLTKDWWVLAYLGAPIWFSITGFRNIIQSVLGGDSFKRSSLLNWKDYVNWNRVSDSLLFTGFSVPLLDYLVKTLVLNNMFNINTSTNIIALYTFMALVNGAYISSHNYFRGLPTSAIIGNFFRSILSIPLAIAYNKAIGGLLAIFGVSGINGILQTWAAVISKSASDTVAGIIEGTADRAKNISIRMRDYKRKINQMYGTYEKMELLLHDKDVSELLKDPDKAIKILKKEESRMINLLIYDALDFLYFWNYQPHARTVFKRFFKEMSPDERLTFLRFQSILRRRKYISTMLINGLIGKNFEKALAFYLSSYEKYLKTMEKLAKSYT